MYSDCKSAHGQTLTEFSIILALVAVVCISGVWAFSGGLSDVLKNLPFFSHGHSQTIAVSAPSPAGSTNPVNTAPVTPPVNLPAPKSSQNNSITLSDGTVIPLPNPLLTVPGSLATAVEAAGVNGTTEMLAFQMDAIIKALKDQGKITADQASILSGLSNQGHHMAAMEGFVSQAVRTPSTFMSDIPVTIDGVTYRSSEAVATALGIAPQSGVAYGDDFDKFQKLYQSVLDSGSLSDPVVKQVVSSLATQIATVAEYVEEQTDYDYINQAGYDINVSTAQGITNGASVKICQTGGGSDFGQYCN